jgi:hypothetical protein
MQGHYFQLRDDLHAPDRWHLGDVTRNGDDQKVLLDAAKPMSLSRLDVEVTDQGVPLDFCFTAFGVAVARSRLAAVVSAVAENDVQQIPTQIGKSLDFNILNVVRIVDCIDEANAEFVKWTADDHRSDLAGQYRWVAPLKLDRRRIPADAHLFRVWGWKAALIVSARLKAAMERAGCQGAKFKHV